MESLYKDLKIILENIHNGEEWEHHEVNDVYPNNKHFSDDKGKPALTKYPKDENKSWHSIYYDGDGEYGVQTTHPEGDSGKEEHHSFNDLESASRHMEKIGSPIPAAHLKKFKSRVTDYQDRKDDEATDAATDWPGHPVKRKHGPFYRHEP